ncbi:MAG: energy-coupling factor ABC transporter permease [Chitinophagales bacterium]
MSHLHLPDGLLPLSWVILGFVLAGAGVAFATWRLAGADRGRLVPRLGIMAALMLLAMNLEVGLFDYHANLTVLAGVLLGPAGGFLAAFIANLFSAFLAHGGLTVVGLNGVVNGLEAAAGGWLFGLLRRNAHLPAATSAVVATVPTLALSTTLRLWILRQAGLFSTLAAAEGMAPSWLARLGTFPRFAALVYLFGAIGWLIEAVLIGGIVAFLAKARPALLEAGRD